MRYWFDTEFIEDGKTIDLLSIGIVSEDGRSYYATSGDADLSKASPWVQENVLPHLNTFSERGSYSLNASRSDIAREILDFVWDGIAKDGEKPEFWAYYADYDWVALCQLYGTMMDLPKGWPMFCRDVKQLADSLGDPPLPEQTGTEHHALADALWTKKAWQSLKAPPTAEDTP
jgi:hypothetical protein